ncbi:MAG: hypothetical protein IPH94_02200 [Saprospiraceae bacterium]|nr:hypothetical protein [Saprospiraceae bacterium]MBK8849325.1 hypothetical protein [Saprospiraceae bacterium]
MNRIAQFTSMKPWIYTLSIVIISLYSSVAQNKDSIIQKLLDNDLIKQNEIYKLEELFHDRSTDKKIIYIYYLFQEEHKKSTGHYFEPNRSKSYLSIDSLTQKKQSQVNSILNELILQLKKVEILNEKWYTEIKSSIAANEYSNYFQFIGELESILAFEELLQPEKLKAFAEKLRNVDIVESEFEHLIDDIDAGKISDLLFFLNYCKYAIIIRANEDTIEDENYLQEIHNKTATLFPDLAFTDFNLKFEVDSSNISNGYILKQLIVSLKNNGKIYKHKSTSSLINVNNYELNQYKLERHKYFKIFNKILRDRQSPYRLHEIVDFVMDSSYFETFGIIALTEDQASFLEENNEYFLIQSEDYFNVLSTIQIETLISNFEKNGLFSKLSDAQIKKTTQDVLELEITEPNDLLLAFPHISFTLPTYIQTFTNPFTEIITQLAKLSNLEFNPSNVIDSLDITKQFTFAVNFNFGNIEYKTHCIIENGIIDLTFIDIINEIAIENKLKGQFYKLKPNTEGTPIIYLTLEQYINLRTENLLTFLDN